MEKKTITIISAIRTRLREYAFKWWWLKATKIYGNRLATTVRLSRTTRLDKVNGGGRSC